jgi:hypothetical protein
MRKTSAVLIGILFAAAIAVSALVPQPAVAQRGGRGGGGAGRGANAAPAPIRRMADGKPDLTGMYQADAGGSNYGLENKPGDGLIPGSRGVVVDPSDGKLPYQPWARAERNDRVLPHRGYDDSTAHCFMGGVPRALYTPSPFQIVQNQGFVLLLFERMNWRQIPLTPREHIPDDIRLWNGDSIGHWEGDTLVVDTRNMNGKAWLNEVGDIMTHDAKITERFTPVNGNSITYRATVTDMLAYTRPWTIQMAMNRRDDELLEAACHEDNGDLQHLKDVRDEYRAQNKKEK